MNDTGGNTIENWGSPRFWIAAGVISVSILGIISLATIVLVLGDGNLETAKTVFSSILPLLATWVGTVLAYYFSKDNFESANRNVREMVSKVTSLQKLQSTPVATAMIPIKDIVSARVTAALPEDKISLVTTLLKQLDDKKRNRLPILDENDRPKYVIHRSIIDRFLGAKAMGGMTSTNLAQLTLKDIIQTDIEEVKKFIRVSFGTVKETDTLADAKREMDRENGRLDVLVTKDGTADSSVVGWITNLIINDNATV